MIVGIVGFINSGKDTAADYLVNFYGFRRDSFANTLKDAVATVFGWDRTLLEGRTKESREWRERVDPWWAERLDMPNLTPRWILQYWGTDVLRNRFHDDIWIASVENKLRKTTDNIVITDVRFPNEVKAIHSAGGIVIRIRRGPDPVWYDDALTVNTGSPTLKYEISKIRLSELGIHASETSWIGTPIDLVIDNSGSIEDLYTRLEEVLKNQESSPLVAMAA